MVRVREVSVSKTKQKKISAYQLGVNDGLLNHKERWIRHPQMEFYREGYMEGRRARTHLPPPRMTIIDRLLFVIFGVGPNGESYVPKC
jgi:hypothetical protein